MFLQNIFNDEEESEAEDEEQARAKLEERTKPPDWSEERWYVRQVLSMRLTKRLILLLIFACIATLVVATDYAVEGDVPLWLEVLDVVIVLAFAIELAAEFFVHRRDFFSKGDLVAFWCVVFDVIVLALSSIVFRHGLVPLSFTFKLVRAVRILRTARVLQIITRFRELNYLLNQMESAFLTIFWGLIMILLVILMWSIVIVNILHPLVSNMLEDSIRAGNAQEIETNKEIERGFSSVWNCMVILTQTLVAGDAWGNSAVPLIQEHPWTYIIFLFALGTVPLCVMNLILAAIVDSGAKTREEAAFKKAAGERKKKAEEEQMKKDKALNLFKMIDDDDSGGVSKEELLIGFEENKEFRATMRALEFEKLDLEILFRVLDNDKSGSVNYNEFLDAVLDAKQISSQHILVFVKFALMDLWRRQFKTEERMDKILGMLRSHETPGSPAKVDSVGKDGQKEKVKSVPRAQSPAAKKDPSPAQTLHRDKKGDHVVKPSNEKGAKKMEDPAKQSQKNGAASLSNGQISNMQAAAKLRSIASVSGSSDNPVSIGTQTTQSSISNDTICSHREDTGKWGKMWSQREDTILSSVDSQKEDMLLSSVDISLQGAGEGDLKRIVLELAYQSAKMVRQSDTQATLFSQLDATIRAVVESLELPMPSSSSTML